MTAQSPGSTPSSSAKIRTVDRGQTAESGRTVRLGSQPWWEVVGEAVSPLLAQRNDLAEGAGEIAPIDRKDDFDAAPSPSPPSPLRELREGPVIAKVSGGEGSWLAARTYLDRHSPDRFEVLFTDTLIEDQDTYRFLIAGVANLLSVSLPAGFLPEIDDFPAWEDRASYKAYVTDLAGRVRAQMPSFHWIIDGRDPFDVYEAERFLGNSSKDPCSKILKRNLSDRWLKANFDPAQTIVLVGIDDTERARFEGSERLNTRGLRAQMAEAGWRFEAPLIDSPLLPWVGDELIAKAGLWHQRLRRLGFSHSNCGGHCCKGGQAHWKRLLSAFPERYAYAERREEDIRAVLGEVSMLTDRRKRPGDTSIVKRPLTLAQLRHRELTAAEAAEVERCSCLFGEAA